MKRKASGRYLWKSDKRKTEKLRIRVLKHIALQKNIKAIRVLHHSQLTRFTIVNVNKHSRLELDFNTFFNGITSQRFNLQSCVMTLPK